MRVLNDTDRYLSSLTKHEDDKKAKDNEDTLSTVLEVFSTLTSTVKDLEKVMINLNTPIEVKPTEENEEE